MTEFISPTVTLIFAVHLLEINYVLSPALSLSLPLFLHLPREKLVFRVLLFISTQSHAQRFVGFVGSVL